MITANWYFPSLAREIVSGLYYKQIPLAKTFRFGLILHRH
jgi:hypothetical protein